ncbi:MAG: hypothetical protein ACHQIO_05165 [Nevskiales bacterium]
MLAMQRALLSRVPNSLIAVSVELDYDVVRVRYIFDDTGTEDEKGLLGEAGTELIGEFSESYRIEEEFLVVEERSEMEHLSSLVFLRYEG